MERGLRSAAGWSLGPVITIMGLLLLLLGSAVWSAAGCSGRGEGTTTSVSNPASSSVLRLDISATGSTVWLSPGVQLEVVLEGNPSAGYTWKTAPFANAVLRQAGEPTFVPFSSLVGAPGTYTFRFEAIGYGQTDLNLSYAGPGEGTVVRTFSVRVIVEKGASNTTSTTAQ